MTKRLPARARPIPPPRSPWTLRTLALCVLVAGALLGCAMGLHAFLYWSRIAAREAAIIAACKSYASAQDIYRRTDLDGDGVLEYATSATGEAGLYTVAPERMHEILVTRAFADACRSADDSARRPFHGYYFRILTGQGPNGPGGEKSYLVNGNMTIGYALLAWPAEYDVTGRNTFQINNTGTVYYEDHGPDTEALAEKTTLYNPPIRWTSE